MSKRREPELPERFEVLAADVRRAWGLHRINPDRHALHRIGRFEALRRLGQGTYGVVYKVRDPELGREVALKLFPTPSSAAAEAFLREAQLLAKFSHPHIVRVFETGRYGDDFFFVMELVEGCTGHELILDWDDVDEALAVYEAAGAGLAAAHAQGILHGDFKPSNVLLGDDDRVCVADFGLARLLVEHARVGTLPYMAPEVLRGEAGDARANQWSFCVALWETLHGLRPFAGETKEELLTAIERGQLDAGEHAERVPDAVRAVVRVGLAIDPGDRFADMQTLIATLRKLRGTAEAEPRRHNVFLRAILISCGVLLGAFGAALWFESRAVGQAAKAVDHGRPAVDPVVEHVLRLIAADDFEMAHTIWKGEVLRRTAMEIPTGPDSLRIAEAFGERAAALAQRDPAKAEIAAGRARAWLMDAIRNRALIPTINVRSVVTAEADPVVGRVLRFIAADEYEKAHETWEDEFARRHFIKIRTSEDSLRIAEAFSERAAALAQRNPARAKSAANHATVWSRIASDYGDYSYEYD